MRYCLVLALVLSSCRSSHFVAASVPAKEAVPHTFARVPSPQLVVATFNGSIEVTVSSIDGAVHATVTKRAEGATQAEAQARLKDFDIAFAVDGKVLRVTARRTVGRSTDGEAADVVVAVPKDSTLTLTSTPTVWSTHAAWASR